MFNRRALAACAALFLKDVMNALAADGWGFVDTKSALGNPVYKLQPKTPHRGHSVLSVLAEEKGVEHSFSKKYYGVGREFMESQGL